MTWMGTAKTLALAVIACASLQAQAQTIYRIVGADGRVTFSDKPPVAGDQAKVTGTAAAASAPPAAAPLPFELRQVVTRYPVTLYTADACEPCSAGRALLNSRGVPFTERTINAHEDTLALQRLSGDTTLPFLSVGSQTLKGFAEKQWVQYLDAAGYPKASLLPRGYRNPAPAPLAPPQKPAEAKAPAASDAGPALPARPPSAPNPQNPAGIQF